MTSKPEIRSKYRPDEPAAPDNSTTTAQELGIDESRARFVDALENGAIFKDYIRTDANGKPLKTERNL